MTTIEPPARAVWFDLEARTERVIEPGEPVHEPDASGFLWLDLELPSPNAVAALVEEGVLPAGALAEDTTAGTWAGPSSAITCTCAGTAPRPGGTRRAPGPAR